MDSTPLAQDSSQDAEQHLIEQWRTMSSERKLAASMQMSRTVRDLALAGVQGRHPDASPREWMLRRAVVLLGRELALAAYPEIAALDQK